MADEQVMTALGQVLDYLGKLTEKVDRIETTMATKEELGAAERRMEARLDENRHETTACKMAIAELTGIVSSLNKATAENTAAVEQFSRRLDVQAKQTAEYVFSDRREISEVRGGLDMLGKRFDALVTVKPAAAAE